LVRSPDHAASLPFYRPGGAPATVEQKRAAFVIVQGAFHKGLLANAYAPLADIRLSLDFCTLLLEQRLTGEFLPAIERAFPACDGWPLSARRAVVDMAYSLGINGLVAKYPRFMAACQTQDWEVAADECHRSREGEDPKRPDTWGGRNAWARAMLLEAAFEEFSDPLPGV
jgi:hypothetical protein